MIRSFGDAALEDFYNGKSSAKARRIPADIVKALRLRLDQMVFAANVNDLRVPPSNHLEALKGDLDGFYSLRVNIQYRLIFKWTGNEATEVRLDAHKY